MKKYRFHYTQHVLHEAVVEAESAEEARDKLENSITEKDIAVESEIDYRETDLVESWE